MSIAVLLTLLGISLPQATGGEAVSCLPNSAGQEPARPVEAPRPRSMLRARVSYRANDPQRPTVCLVHGINSTSGSFLHLIPILEKEGYGVVVYDYPYALALTRTAPEFEELWRRFRETTGDRQAWSILSHSMGALLARSYVEGDRYAGDVASLILIGPPNRGSALAPAQDVLAVIERMRAARDPGGQEIVVLGDRIEAAAKDLTPGSPFLSNIAKHGPREGVPYFILAGDVGFLTLENRKQIEAQYRIIRRRAGFLAGLADAAVGNLPAILDVLTDGTGDGAVAVSSTRLEGAAEHVVIPSNHVELIRGPLFFPEPGPVDCEPYVLRWLAESLPIDRGEVD